MKSEALLFKQPTQHYSLLSLMYGQQFNSFDDYSALPAGDFELLQKQELAGHIEDFCDCV